MDKKTYIYVLIDPRNLTNRYIGKTDNIRTRYNKHCRDFREDCYKVHWLRQLYDIGIKPILEILEECDESVWERRERWWIAYGRFLEWPLTNTTAGGEGGATRTGDTNTPESRAKMSKALKGRIFTDEHKLNLSTSAKGRKATQETRDKHSASLIGNDRALGYKHSEETKRKESEIQRGEGNGNNKLKVEDILYIRNSTERTSVLARKYKIACHTVWCIRTRKSWSHLE